MFDMDTRISELEFSLVKNYKSILSVINESSTFAIAVHLNPDADALGSALALAEFLKNSGKAANVFIHGLVPSNLHFLPSVGSIISYSDENSDDFSNSDVIFALDLNEPKRLASLEQAYTASKAKKILIDHHIGPSRMADIIVSETSATSTGELIYKLFELAGATELSKDSATCLYAAIMADTGGFRFDKTSGDTFRIAAKLADSGADPVMIYDEVYNTMSAEAVRLLGATLAGMEIYCNGGLVIMTISADDFARTRACEMDIENFSDRLLMVSGARMGVLLSEITDRGETRISFRSKNGISVREVAAEYGGGGHKQAAGARVANEPFESVVRMVTKRAIDYFEGLKK